MARHIHYSYHSKNKVVIQLIEINSMVPENWNTVAIMLLRIMDNAECYNLHFVLLSQMFCCVGSAFHMTGMAIAD